MSITARNTDRALLVLRIALATVFIAHGSMKLFVMGHDGVTGFVFNEFSASAFAEAIARAIVAYRDRDTWFRMMRDAMARDFGWERSEERYRDLYRTVLSAR